MRADTADDADDRAEFEADMLLALLRALSRGALAITGSGRGAAARVVLGGAGAAATPPAAVIRQAADLLGLVVDASDPATLPAAAAGQGTGSAAAAAGAGSLTPGVQRTGSASGGSGTFVVSGLGTAPAHPPLQQPAAAGGKLRHQGSGGRSAAAAAGPPQQQQQQDGGAGSVGINPLEQPVSLLPSVVTDHTSGLAVLRTWSSE